MALQLHTMEALDSQGASHTYNLADFPAGAGFDLFLELADMVAHPLGLMIGSAKTATPGGPGDPQTSGNGKQGPEDLQDEDAPGGAPGSLLDADINGDMLGRGLGMLAKAIMAKGGHHMVVRLLSMSHAIRDGSKFSASAVSPQGCWSFEVYRRNYGEILTVLVKILEINFAPLAGGLPSSLGGVLGMAIPGTLAAGPLSA